jgi:hypothetical protein
VGDLLASPDRARALGTAARRRSSMFGRDTVLRAYLAAYRDAIENAQSGRR